MKVFLRVLYWEWLAWSRDPLAAWLARRELRKHMERSKKIFWEPESIEAVREIPPSSYLCRRCGTTGKEPCTHGV